MKLAVCSTFIFFNFNFCVVFFVVFDWLRFFCLHVFVYFLNANWIKARRSFFFWLRVRKTAGEPFYETKAFTDKFLIRQKRTLIRLLEINLLRNSMLMANYVVVIVGDQCLSISVIHQITRFAIKKVVKWITISSRLSIVWTHLLVISATSGICTWKNIVAPGNTIFLCKKPSHHDHVIQDPYLPFV